MSDPLEKAWEAIDAWDEENPNDPWCDSLRSRTANATLVWSRWKDAPKEYQFLNGDDVDYVIFVPGDDGKSMPYEVDMLAGSREAFSNVVEGGAVWTITHS